MSDEEKSPSAALNLIVGVLEGLDADTRDRVLKSVAAFFSDTAVLGSVNGAPASSGTHERIQGAAPSFATHTIPSPKEFIAQKQPKTDVERIACLAYYLTHYREAPYFKTLELAKLNTEAAYPKFSNAAYAANNASMSGYLAPASDNQRQISAAGEQFVQALPDRDAAKAAMAAVRRRRSPSRKK